MTNLPSPDILEQLQSDYGLDEFQAPAANHLDGPALVLASAGSGKTTTLTARVIHLIKHYHIPPDQILCITFTNKATQNMVSKIESKIGKLDVPPFISTIHSLGLFIIRKNPILALRCLWELANFRPPEDETIDFHTFKGLTLWDERECRVEFTRFLKSQNLDLKINKDLLDNIFYLTNRGFTPGSYSALKVHDPKRLKLERVILTDDDVDLWKQFFTLKAQSRTIDFCDMILLASMLLEKHPKILAKYHEKWNYILQDEAQDASPLQWNFLTLLTNSKNNIYAVGDLSQNIMGFQGSEPQLLSNYQDDFRGVKPAFFHLQNNYRSHPTIVNLANALEHHLIGFHPNPMIAKSGIPGNTPALSYQVYDDNTQEANDIGSTILELADVPAVERSPKLLRPQFGRQPLRPFTQAPTIKPRAPKPFKLKDIVILVRTKLMIPAIENAFLTRQIPYYVKEGKSLLQTKEVMDLMAYFKFMINPYDVHSFSRAVQTPRIGFGDESIHKIVDDAHEANSDIYSLCRRYAKLLKFTSVVDKLQSDMTRDPLEVKTHIETWASLVNYEEEIRKTAKRDVDDEERRKETLSRFTLLAQEILTKNPDITSISELFDYISLMQDAGRSTSDDNRVHIMTAHSAKGLEYQVVFAPCFYDGAIPHIRSLKRADELAEEARLAYVITTRAIRQLRISRPKYFLSVTAKEAQQTQQSRFLIPMLPFLQESASKLL